MAQEYAGRRILLPARFQCLIAQTPRRVLQRKCLSGSQRCRIHIGPPENQAVSRTVIRHELSIGFRLGTAQVMLHMGHDDIHSVRFSGLPHDVRQSQGISTARAGCNSSRPRFPQG